MIIRLPTIITAIIMAGAAGYTFDVKRGVIGLERELRDIRRETEEIEARTQGLMAEWARLNDVERLRSLADRHLAGLVAMQPVQLQRVDEAARRLPNPLAFAGPASPFLPRQETQLAEAPAVNKEVKKAVERANKELAGYEAIKKFRILPQDFSIDGGELTPTMKVRTKKVLEKYKDVITALYGSKDDLL
jgi:long-subunit acyl-CoA synthetase (AMP-forming)